MRASLFLILLASSMLLSAGSTQGQPPEGSQLSLDENMCATCHGEEDLWDEEMLQLYVPLESLANDIHWQKGVNCHDCHGGDPTSFDVPVAHATDLEEGESEYQAFRSPLPDTRRACAVCHQEQQVGLETGVHSPTSIQDEPESELPTDCSSCHGSKAHEILPSTDANSPAFPTNQVQLCGDCHKTEHEEYLRSVHGHGLVQSGLMVTAVCSDCHDSHKILQASDPESTLHATNVAQTCATCHRFIEERLMVSVHGAGDGLGTATEEAAPGGETYRRPSCTDCHQGHDLPHPRSQEARSGVANRCGGCHVDPSNHYFESIHGKLTNLGYAPAAQCSDCHGAHDIVPLDDSKSPVAVENRRETCMQCHDTVAANLVTFDPHANPKDRERNPLLYYSQLGMEILLFSVFGFFGIHTLLWFVRSLVDVVRRGRPKRLVPGEIAIRRFRPVHRGLHLIVIVSFLGLAATGLPLKYSSQPWAQNLVDALGGFGSTSTWHRIFGVATFFYFGTHLVWMTRKIRRLKSRHYTWMKIVFGPDSPVPTLRDFKDGLRMVRWFFGLGPKPGFERWAYWEKFDYWAVFWGVAIIGTSGLILWFPNLFCSVLPGQVLNIAKLIHSEEALLATGFVFAIHFFHSHIRAEKFPMDMSILSGLVSEEEFLEERPEYYERLKSEGKFDELRATVPSQSRLTLIFIGGTVALLVGLGLLVGIFAGVLGG